MCTTVVLKLLMMRTVYEGGIQKQMAGPGGKNSHQIKKNRQKPQCISRSLFYIMVSPSILCLHSFNKHLVSGTCIMCIPFQSLQYLSIHDPEICWDIFVARKQASFRFVIIVCTMEQFCIFTIFNM